MAAACGSRVTLSSYSCSSILCIVERGVDPFDLVLTFITLAVRHLPSQQSIPLRVGRDSEALFFFAVTPHDTANRCQRNGLRFAPAAGSSSIVETPTDFQGVPERPAHVLIHMESMIAEAWDFAVASCLRPASRNLGTGTTTTPNLAEYEASKRTLHYTANERDPFHSNGLRPPCWWVRRLGTQLGQRLRANPHRTPSDINPELPQRTSSSHHGDTACATLRRVQLASTRGALPLLPLPSSLQRDPGTTPYRRVN